MSCFGSLKSTSFVPVTALVRKRGKTVESATAKNKGIKQDTEDYKRNGPFQICSTNNVPTANPAIGRPGYAPSSRPAHSSKSSLFTIASLLGSTARAQKGSTCDSTKTGASTSSSSGDPEAVQELVPSLETTVIARGSAGVNGPRTGKQVVGTKRESTGTHTSLLSHVTKKPRLLGILRGGRRKQAFHTFKSTKCRGIEEVLSKRLSHSHPMQSGEGEGGERGKRDGRPEKGSLTREHSSDGSEGESITVAHGFVKPNNSNIVVRTQSSSLASNSSSSGTSIVPDSDGTIHPVTNSNKTPSSSDPEADGQHNSQPENCVTTEAGGRGCRQKCSQNMDGSCGTNTPATATPTSATPTSATPSSATPTSATTTLKISPPKQHLSRTRILSPLVTHSHRLSVMHTLPSHNSKEEELPIAKKAKRSNTEECSTNRLDLSPTHPPLSQGLTTSCPSPPIYTALLNPWTPSMDWQYPSILSMLMSPTLHLKHQSESAPLDFALPEQTPKWMWTDLFTGLSSNGGASTLPSPSLFSPPQLFSQPLSQFSPSQLLNLPMPPKVDSYPVTVSPPMYHLSGSDGGGGGGEGGSLEENPFQGMQRAGRKEEQSVIPPSGAGGEAGVEAQAPKRRLVKGRENAAELKVQGESSSTKLHRLTHSTQKAAMGTTQESSEPNAPFIADTSQIPSHVFASQYTHLPPAPITGCPTPNSLDPAHFCHPPCTQMPYSPSPSWQMLVTQMNGLLQLQNIQKNIERHPQPLSVHSPPCDVPVATPTDNQDHLSRVFPIVHHPNMPFMGYSRAGFESTFQSGCGPYKSNPVDTGISHFSHLSDPTSHHASCKDGYCHHIEEHLKKASKRRKRKLPTPAKLEEDKPKDAVASCRQGLRKVIQEAVKSTATTAKTSHSTRFGSPTKLRRHMVQQAQSFLHRYQRVVAHKHTF